MRYTKYFAQLVKQYGVPQLPPDEMSTFLNIVHLEAKKQVYSDLNNTNRFVVHIKTIDDKLDELTGRLDPKELINRWQSGLAIRKSKSHEEDTPWDENEEYFNPKRRG